MVDEQWFDFQTRVIVVASVLYNPNVRFFTLSQHVVEIDASGNIGTYSIDQPFTIQPWLRQDLTSWVLLVMDGVTFTFVIALWFQLFQVPSLQYPLKGLLKKFQWAASYSDWVQLALHVEVREGEGWLTVGSCVSFRELRRWRNSKVRG